MIDSARVVIALPGNEPLAEALALRVGAELGRLTLRAFPDGESYVCFDSPVEGRSVALVCTLHQPDQRTLPLYLSACTARALGAERIGLVAPYLAYMRQDARFRPGEGVTSVYFARLLSGCVDWLVTVDPHLHRHRSLDDIYRIPAVAVAAAPAMAGWIAANVPDPVLIGPDEESAQWVAAVAAGAGAPYVVLEKRRHGDHDVEVSVPDVERWRDRTPVLVDDIISTARTMIAGVEQLRRAGLRPPVCVGVHAVFAEDAEPALLAAGAAQVVTCDTIPHGTNRISVVDVLAPAVRAIAVATTAR